MARIRCVEGVNGCKRTSGDLLITQRVGPAKVSTSGTQWSLVGHFIQWDTSREQEKKTSGTLVQDTMVACRTLYPTQISRRPLLCRSNSRLEIIIVQSVAWPPLQSLHMGDPPPPNHNLCHSSLESRTEISHSCTLRKSMNGNCLKSNLAHDVLAGAFWKSETFLVVNGSWPDTASQKPPFSWQLQNPGRDPISNLNCGKQ